MTRSGFETRLEGVVTNCLKGEYPAGRILSVELTDEYENDGDHVLVFTVEYEGAVADFVAGAPLSLSRVVAERLRELEVPGFPFLDFVPTDELRA